ncbi:MAG: hypothetical protein ACRDTC_11200 [Pseudonocardiaceae bacterium]
MKSSLTLGVAASTKDRAAARAGTFSLPSLSQMTTGRTRRKDDGKRDVGRDGDTGKRTGDKIDPKQWENQKHWGDRNDGNDE